MENVFRETKKDFNFFPSVLPDFPAHIHDDIELIFVFEGSGTAFCDGEKYELSSGSFFVVFPNQVHHYSEFSKGNYLVLIIKPSQLLSYNNIFLDGRPSSAVFTPHNEEEKEAIYLFDLAYKEFNENGLSPVVSALITAVFGKLLRSFNIEKSFATKSTALQILQYCSAHFKEDITVESVAKALRISRSSISHTFSNRVSMSFNDYINSLRLDKACQYLKNKSLSITEISDLSGFPTVRTFNRAFLKKYNTTPTEYRKTN